VKKFLAKLAALLVKFGPGIAEAVIDAKQQQERK